jgi:ATP-dependent helicase/nuclease subunit B
VVVIDEEARAAIELVGSTVDGALAAGFLPAAPRSEACTYCDYIAVCGPYEQQRSARKDSRRIEPLVRLRKHP